MNNNRYPNPGIQNPEFRIQNTAQLDLGLGARSSGTTERWLSPSFRRRQRLRVRAQWWFDQMRRAVDSAVEWKPAPPARPEQTAFDLRGRTEVVIAK